MRSWCKKLVPRAQAGDPVEASTTSIRRTLRAGFYCGLLLAATAGARGAGDESARASALAGLRVDPFVSGPVLEARRVRGFKAEVAHRIFAGEGGGELAIAALAVPLPGAGPTVEVQLFVEIDGASLLRSNRSATAVAEIYVYAIGPGSSVVGHLAQSVAFDAGALADSSAGLKFYGQLRLPPGSYDLRVLVRDPRSRVDGVVVLPLEIAAGSPSLVPILAAPEGRWLAVRQGSVDGSIAEEYPFLVDGRALSPSARPVLAYGREVRLHIFGRDLPSGPLSGTVRFLAAGSPERAAGVARIDSVDPPTPSARGLERRTVRFRLPELLPGEYPMRLELREPSGSVSRTVSIPVWVLAADARERDLLWTDLRWMMAGAEAQGTGIAATATDPATHSILPSGQAVVPEAMGGRRSRRVRRAAERYRSALAAVARRPLAQSRTAVLDLESEVVGRGSDRLTQLQAAEILVASELADRDVDALAPLLELHLGLYRSYRDRRLHSLAAHSRILVEHLGELYAQRGGSPALAANVLASLGGYLQQSDLTASSERLFRRALALAPGHRAALLGLAANFERTSKYGRALEPLEQLVQTHPDCGEGKLRLAINLERMGMKRRSSELLREVVEGAAPAWVMTLAYQALARRQLETGGFEQAAELLRSATVEAPAEPGAYHLLAYVSDRLKRPEEALEVVSAVRRLPANGNASAAKVYDSWPRQALADSRRSLAAAAEQHRPSLGAALKKGS